MLKELNVNSENAEYLHISFELKRFCIFFILNTRIYIACNNADLNLEFHKSKKVGENHEENVHTKCKIFSKLKVPKL
jgi:hypothetical protein